MKYTQEQGKLPQTYVITTQWKKPRYGMLSERDTVAFGLERTCPPEKGCGQSHKYT